MALIKRNTTYQVGDIGYTTFGVKLKCTTAGTTDTNPLNLPPHHSYISIIDGTVTWEIVEENHVSIGTIISYMGNAVPERFLACDGTIYNINDYQSLADHINIEFGSVNYFGGDGTTTFAVPDLRGEFLRGTGTNSHTNQGDGANVGVHQDATEENEVKLLGGEPSVRSSANSSTTSLYPKNTDHDIRMSTGQAYWRVNANFRYQSEYNSSYAHTSRPTNTSVLYCIKYI